MRNNKFLLDRLEMLWQAHFDDVPQKNKVIIRFGRRAVKRLGSIRQSRRTKDTLILINGYFKNQNVPSFIVDATIVHELCHYAHGFSSPLPQLSRYPHRGGLVDREIVRRGLGGLLQKETSWLNANWFKFIRHKI